MKNSTKTNEVLRQVQLTCLEIAHGCERAVELDLGEREFGMMAEALFELYQAVEKCHRAQLEATDAQAISLIDAAFDRAEPQPQPCQAERLPESMKIDSEKDHDGDTQPANEKPEPSWPGRCGFVAHSEDGSRELVCQRELRHEGPHYSGPVAPLPPDTLPPSEPAWMKDPPSCQCGHGRDVHGPAGPATPHAGLVCYMVDCPCKQFAAC